MDELEKRPIRSPVFVGKSIRSPESDEVFPGERITMARGGYLSIETTYRRHMKVDTAPHDCRFALTVMVFC